MSEFTLIIVENIPPAALQAIHRVIGLEGGYVHDAADRGGKTNFGISDLRDGVADGLIDINLDGLGDIAPESLTYEQAVSIYYKDYWLANQCNELPTYIAVMVFDVAVNQGGKFARKTLQGAAGVNTDGIIGGKTLAAVSQCTELQLLHEYTQLRVCRYASIVKRDITQLKFLNGWLNRAFDVLKECQMIWLFGGHA